jgi:Family of unknown function (DUF5906)
MNAEAGGRAKPDSELTIDDYIEEVSKLAESSAPRDDPVMRGLLDDPSTIEAVALSRMAERSSATPADRKEKAKAVNLRFDAMLARVLSLKGATAQNKRYEGRIRAKLKEARTTQKSVGLDARLVEFNRLYAVVIINNKARIVETGPPPPGTPGNPFPRILRALARADFVLKYDRERYFDDTGRFRNIAEIWLEWKERKTYGDGIEFDPSHKGTRPGATMLNLFWGWSITPAAKDKSIDPFAGIGWSKFRDHLLNTVCGGDYEFFKWVVCWHSDIVQNPAKKKGTSLAMRGGQGVGKTKVAETFGRIFGAHTYIASGDRSITGNFNEAMFGRVYVVLEESIWAGDKVAAGIVRDLKTRDSMEINPKGIAPFSTANHCRFTSIGNAQWLIDAPEDDRRDTVADVGEGHKGDTAYFAAIDREMMEKGGDEAMLRDLLAIDLSEIDLRKPYVTAALIEQRELSMSVPQRWLLDLLRRGSMEHSYLALDNANTAPVSAFVDDFVAFAGRLGDRGRKADESALGKEMQHVFGTGLGKRSYVTVRRPTWDYLGNRTPEKDHSERQWCRQLPPLDEARKTFMNKFGAFEANAWFEGSKPTDVWDFHCKDPRGRKMQPKKNSQPKATDEDHPSFDIPS